MANEIIKLTSPTNYTQVAKGVTGSILTQKSDGDRGKLADVELTQPNFMPNSYTDSNGITYTWTEGNGW